VLEEEVKRLRKELKTVHDKNFQLEEQNSKLQIRVTEIGELKVTQYLISGNLQSHSDIEKKIMHKMEEELKKFHKQLDEKVHEIQVENFPNFPDFVETSLRK
jgi:vacuolar-type H+-ATPase subunit I/STV1